MGQKIDLPDFGILDPMKDELLSGSPDIPLIESLFIEKLNLSPKEARELVYSSILKINSSLFPSITQMELILTQGCNLACGYCFEKEMLGYRRMPEDIARKAIDLLFNYSGHSENLNTTLFGGEPLLNLPALKSTVKYAEKKAAERGKSIFFNMTTNGTLITENIAEYLSAHKIKALVSIDGMQATHDRFRTDKSGKGTFEPAVEGLMLLKGRQLLGVKMTVMPEAAKDLYENVMGLMSLGVTHFVIGHASGVAWSEDDITEFSSQWERLFRWYSGGGKDRITIIEFEEGGAEGAFFGCQAGRNSVSVNIDGSISPCSKMLGLDGKNIIGKLGDVEYGMTNLKNRIGIAGCAELIEECVKKGIDKDYQGGCFATNFDENKNIFNPSLLDYRMSKMKKNVTGCSSCK